MAFRALDIVSDVIYLMDVAIQSRTAYLEDGCLVSLSPSLPSLSPPPFSLSVSVLCMYV